MVRINWLVTSLATLGLAATAEAHFKLVTPAAYSQQSSYGDPQKSAPCGQADPGNPAVPTNTVTAVQSGAMLTITINETIPHPGHYRVAVAQNMAELPADPPVTAGSTACGSTVIDPSPTLPLLGDGLLVHTQAFSNPMQTMQVPIPAGMTCTGCVLQVVEFMSNHGLNNPGGCFYHHCATVNISPDAPPPGDDAGGGGCSAGRGSAVMGGLGGLVAGLALRRRRRARR